jgi:hypothetical protein
MPTTKIRQKFKSRLAYGWEASLSDNPVSGRSSMPGTDGISYSPALPALPDGGVVTLTVDGAEHGGLLRLEITDAEFPDGRWQIAGSKLVKEESGSVSIDVPTRIGNGQPVSWVRSYYGAARPTLTPWEVKQAGEGHHIVKRFPPHTVRLSITLEEK